MRPAESAVHRRRPDSVSRVAEHPRGERIVTAAGGRYLAVAAVAPGNVASVRAALAAGFVPAGSIQLFSRDRRAAFGGACG